MALTVTYTTVSKMLLTLPAAASMTNVSSVHLAEFAGRAEAVINGYLAKRYSLPLSGSHPLVETIATDLALYYLLSRRLFTQERMNKSEWPDRFKESFELLKMLSEGKLSLATDSGDITGTRPDLGFVFSNTKDYTPTFDEGPESAWRQDEDKLDDLAREKGDGVLFDILN